MDSKVKVLILGGGSGGISVASRLAKQGKAESIAIVEPSSDHFYQPLWTLVGAGLVSKEKSRRPESKLIPKGCQWIQAKVARVIAEKNQVELESGETIEYKFLVVATGLTVDFDRIRGLKGNLGKNGVCCIYDYEQAEKTSQMLHSFTGGRAIFTMPPVPIKCAGAPQKIMYLAEEIFRKNGIKNKTQIVFATAGKVIFGVPEFATALNKVVKRKGIETQYSHRLVEIKAAEKIAVFEVSAEGKTSLKELNYDLLHVVPPMSAHSYLKQSELAFESGPQAGWLEVDQNTLQHRRYPNVFGIGDVTGVPNSKTGAAIRKQAPVVVANLIAVSRGQKPTAQYDGYSSCPLVTESNRVILAEFGYDGKLMPSFPFDQTKERRSMWYLKRYFLPKMYWHGMMKGRM